MINGLGTVIDTDWEDVIKRGTASGKTVIGYVRTGYLGVSCNNSRHVLVLTSWRSGLRRFKLTLSYDIRMSTFKLSNATGSSSLIRFRLYPGMIGGIFFDEGCNSCGDDNEYAELYRLITENT